MQAEWRKTYEQTSYRELPWFSPRPYPTVQEAVEGRWLKRGTRVLDIGCGAGTNALFLARHGYRVSGVDLAPAAIHAAQTRAGRAGLETDFRVADALRLPYGNATFGGANDVGCFHTLPIRLRSAYAAELARVLRPKGRYVLAWVARESVGSLGPPHRPSLEEVSAAFEEKFLFLRTKFFPGADGSLPAYGAIMERRARPRPPPR